MTNSWFIYVLLSYGLSHTTGDTPAGPYRGGGDIASSQVAFAIIY